MSELGDYLHGIHLEAGRPSTRTLARLTGVSHTTIADALSGRRTPSWTVLEPLVTQLGGSLDEAKRRWKNEVAGEVFCPIHRTALLYNRKFDQSACRDPECVYAHGIQPEVSMDRHSKVQKELAEVFKHYDALPDSDPAKHEFYAFIYMKLSHNSARRAADLKDLAERRRPRSRHEPPYPGPPISAWSPAPWELG